MRALRQNALGVAKNAFERLKDIKYLSFIENLQRDFEGGDDFSSPSKGRMQSGGAGVGKLDFASEAELLAYEGHFNEAAKLYARNGRPEEAIRMLHRPTHVGRGENVCTGYRPKYARSNAETGCLVERDQRLERCLCSLNLHGASFRCMQNYL